MPVVLGGLCGSCVFSCVWCVFRAIIPTATAWDLMERALSSVQDCTVHHPPCATKPADRSRSDDGGLPTTFEELSRKNIARCREVYPKVCSIAPERLAGLLRVQFGELCRLVKSLQAGDVLDTHDMGQQIADAIICADVLCWRFGIVLGDAIVERFNANAENHGSTVRLGE